jgi:hypothetical protein
MSGSIPEQHLIPRFPGEYLPLNQAAIDFSADGVVAVACGSCTHFSQFTGDSLIRGYSTSVSDHPVTALRFHPKQRQIAIGDSCGSTFVWELDSRTNVSYIHPKSAGGVCAFEWRFSILIVLKHDGRLFGLSYSAATSPTSHHFSVIWEVPLELEFTSMSLNPHTGNHILLAGFRASFGIYGFASASDPAVAQIAAITAYKEESIVDAQWCQHLPGHVFLAFSGEICIFSVASQSLIAVGRHQKISSPFHRLIQFPSEHRHLFVLHKSGTLSIMDSSSPSALVLSGDVVHKQKHQRLIGFCKSALDDSFLILWYWPTGLALYDIPASRVTAFLPLIGPRLTAFGSDGTSIALCTDDGCIINTDLFDVERTQLFRVAHQPVVFAAICPSRNRVFWQTASQLGYIDLVARVVTVYGGHRMPVRRSVGSFEGALLVQRTDQVLGMFIDDREIPVLLVGSIVDFCFDEGLASPSEGRFAVLVDSDFAILHGYSTTGVAEFKKFAVPRGTLSIAWRDTVLAYGCADGSVATFDLPSSKVTLVCRYQSWRPRSLMVCEQIVFGLTGTGHVFTNGERSTQKVESFYAISAKLLIVMTAERFVEVVTLPGFVRLIGASKSFPLPPRGDFLRRALATERPFVSRDGRDAWLGLSPEPPMRLVGLCGLGDCRAFQDVELRIFREAELGGDQAREVMFPALVFADRFAEASELLQKLDAGNRYYIQSMLLATLATLGDIGEQQQRILKAAAVSLVRAGQVDDAAIFFRFAKLDRLAIQSFLDVDRPDMALRFLRLGFGEEDKHDALLECGGYLLRVGELGKAVPFLAGCKEFHPLLYALYTLGEVFDGFFLKRWAEREGVLRPLVKGMEPLVGNIIGLDELCHMIDAEFQLLLTSLNVDIKLYFLEDT